MQSQSAQELSGELRHWRPDENAASDDIWTSGNLKASAGYTKATVQGLSSDHVVSVLPVDSSAACWPGSAGLVFFVALGSKEHKTPK